MSLVRVLYALDARGLTPYTITRSGSVGAYRDIDGLLKQAPANTLRITWEELNGVLEPFILTEAPRTNLLLRSEELDNASWGKTGLAGTPIIANAVVGPTGATILDTIVEDTGNSDHHVSQAVTGMTADAPYALSAWVVANTRTWCYLRMFETADANNIATGWFNLATGAVGSTVAGGTAAIVTSYVEDWTHVVAGLYRCVFVASVGNGATAITARLGLATADVTTTYLGDGSSIHGGCVQLEDNAREASSYIPTTSASASRGAETLTAALPYSPADMMAMGGVTFYEDFIECMVPNWVTEGGTDPRILHVGASNGSAPLLRLYREAGSTDRYVFRHNNGSTSSGSAVDLNPVRGSRIQHAAHFRQDGSVQLFGRKDGTTNASGSVSSAVQPHEDWSDNVIHHGGRGTVGRAIQKTRRVIVAAGIHDISTMEALPLTCVLGGYAVPLELGSVQAERPQVGDRLTTYPGTVFQQRRANPSSWRATTTPLTVADANTLLGILEAADQPQAAFGEMFRHYSGEMPQVFTKVESRALVQSGTERRYKITFRVEES